MLGVLIINRLGTYIPVIGVNVPMLSDLMQQKSGVGGLLSYFDIFSGGALSRCTVFALGISPYITASIMLQILGVFTMIGGLLLIKAKNKGWQRFSILIIYLFLIDGLRIENSIIQ